MMNKTIRLFSLISFILVALVLGACGNSAATPVIVEGVTEIAEEATEAPTQTLEPTPTPMTRKAVLVAPPAVRSEDAAWARTRINDRASESGLTLEVVEQVMPEMIGSDWALVVFLIAPDNLDALRNSAVETQFVVISDAQMEGQGNLTVLYRDPYEQAFMAGYVSMLAAPDWRLGGLLPWPDETTGQELIEAFTNGANYFCGRCASVYMPVALFPKTSSLTPDSAPEEWTAAFDSLHTQYYLYTVYAAPEAASSTLLAHLAEMNMVIVGGETPTDQLGDRWAATVDQDAIGMLDMIWDDLLAGNGGQTVHVPVSLRDVNAELLSGGRMRLVDETIQLLNDGYLEPLSPDYP
ncbi:MAG: hypothetical protein JW750_11990 [Anaerolineaceae bacterium]|nr:hypothetical protein [Anaerolineaceae bacterium]